MDNQKLTGGVTIVVNTGHLIKLQAARFKRMPTDWTIFYNAEGEEIAQIKTNSIIVIMKDQYIHAVENVRTPILTDGKSHV